MRARLGKDAMREYKYYRSNAGKMKYDEYRANGWFIGSGVIESRTDSSSSSPTSSET